MTSRHKSLLASLLTFFALAPGYWFIPSATAAADQLEVESRSVALGSSWCKSNKKEFVSWSSKQSLSYRPGEFCLTAQNRRGEGFILLFQPDGNLVLHNSDGVFRRYVWSSKTREADRLTLQPNGNIAIYKKNRVVWSTLTGKRRPGVTTYYFSADRASAFLRMNPARRSGLPTPTGTLLWTSSPPKVKPRPPTMYSRAVSYILIEMRRNGAIAAAMPFGTIEKSVWFANQVAAGHPWDHKTVLAKWFPGTTRGSQRYMIVPGTKFAVNYDIWSNIHYGYVGTKLNLPALLLQEAAAHAPGSGVNDLGDRMTIQIGIDTPTPPRDLDYAEIDKRIRSKLEEIATTTSAAILKSKCLKTARSECEGPTAKHVLFKGEVLKRGEKLEINIPDYEIMRGDPPRRIVTELVMQKDGNLVLLSHSPTAKETICWAAGTQGKGAYAKYEADGRLAIYSATNELVWWTGTKGEEGSSVNLTRYGGLWVGNVAIREMCLA